jgi:DNA replication protein DnaC
VTLDKTPLFDELMKTFFPNGYNVISEKPLDRRPKTVAICPCRYLAKKANLKKYIQKKLGNTDSINLRQNQAIAFDKIISSKKNNIWIYGEPRAGKTTLLIYYLLKLIDTIDVNNIPSFRVFIGQELTRTINEIVLNKSGKFPRWAGFVIIDDVDKISQSNFNQGAIWDLFDRVDKKKLKIICTSNKSPKDYMSKLYFEDLGKFNTVMLRIKEKFSILRLNAENTTLF